MNFTTRAALAVLAAVLAPASAWSAESFDNCKGFIDALPATISTQGVWCLRKDLSTAMSSGNAITVATNNVTIDCNGYRVGGLAGGPSTDAIGIAANPAHNVTVRGCKVRGFRMGIDLHGNGNLVEDNRLDANTQAGISAFSAGAGMVVVRRNLVRDTGGRPGMGFAFGITASGNVRVIDNDIQGVSPTGDTSGDGSAYGILAHSSIVLRNRVSGLVPAGNGQANGSEAMFSTVAENVFAVAPGTQGTPVYGHYLCERNVFTGFSLAPIKCPAPSNTIQP